MRRAAYRPTYPPPTTRILGRSVVLMATSIHLLGGGTSCAPSQGQRAPLLHCAARMTEVTPPQGNQYPLRTLSTPLELPFTVSRRVDHRPTTSARNTYDTARDTRNRDLWAPCGGTCPRNFGRQAPIPCEELHELSRDRPPGRRRKAPRKPDNAVIETPGPTPRGPPERPRPALPDVAGAAPRDPVGHRLQSVTHSRGVHVYTIVRTLPLWPRAL